MKAAKETALLRKRSIRRAHRTRRATTTSATRVAVPTTDDAGATAVAPPTTIADDCSVDVSSALSAWLNALPAGSVVQPPAGACYLVDRGVTLRTPDGLTIDGGKYENKTTLKTFSGAGAGRATFSVVGGADVTLENLTVVGANVGGYHAALAFEAGIAFDGTSGATVDDVHVWHVYGDCLTLDPLRSGHGTNGIVSPVTDAVVTNFWGAACGRQGIAPVSVDGATFSNLTIRTTGFESLDFEADTRGEGARNVVVDGCTLVKPVNISSGGHATGPITVENCAVTGASGDAVIVKNTSGSPDNGPIVFSGDSFRCGASVYVSCFELHGASSFIVANSKVQLGFRGDGVHEGVYHAGGDSHVAFADDVVGGYGHPGTTQPSSTTLISGGAWLSRLKPRT
jgi:hypothetical protein